MNNKRIKITLPRFGNSIVYFLQRLELLAVKTSQPTKSEKLLLKQHSIQRTTILETSAVNELLLLKKECLEELVSNTRQLLSSLEKEVMEVNAKLSSSNLRKAG